jgi:hypothetical protein
MLTHDRRIYLLAALFVAPIVLFAAGGRTGVCADVASSGPCLPTPAEQFYTRVSGQWVGTTISRLDDAPPVTGYFHLTVSRVDDHTFQEEYTFYRIHPKTGVLERSGTQIDLSTMEGAGALRRSCKGSGTVLIDYKPKNQRFEASGEARFTSPDHLEAEVKGKIAVDGMPLNLGKNGKLRKATASWSLEDGQLIGQTAVETSFRALLFTKRYRIQTELRAQRGTSVQALAGRVPAS